MAKRTDTLVQRFPEDLREILRRMFDDIDQAFAGMRKHFEPNDPRLLRTLIVISAILFVSLLLSQGLRAWLTLGSQ